MIKISFKNKIFETNSKTSFYDQLYSIKKCAGTRYRSDNKTWTIEPRVSNYKLIKHLFDANNELHSYVNELIQASQKKSTAMTDSIKTNYPFLYDFQVDTIKKALSSPHKGMLIGLDPGLGKTLVSLIISKELQAEKIWIICPASLMLQWKNEIIKWLKEEDINIYKGSKAKRVDMYGNDYKYNIISYETFRNDVKLLELKNKLKGSVLISDESSKLKNSKSQIYKAFKEVSKIISYKMFLTGTPLTNGLKDINNVINLIKLYLAGSISQYCIVEQQSVGWGRNARVYNTLIGYKNLDMYVEKVKSVYERKSKEEVGDQLPSKTIVKVPISQSSKHMKIEENILEEIGAFSGFTLLMMLENGIEVINKSESESAELIDFPDKFENPKLEALTELVEDIGDNQIIIFTKFINSAENILQHLSSKFKDKKIVTTNEGDKDKTKEEFLNKQIDIVIATDKWSHGVSLSTIDYLINFDIIPSLEVYLQRIDRIHRLDSTRAKFIYNLVGDIIEHHILEILENKLILFEQIVEGKAGKVEDVDIKKLVSNKLNKVK